MTACFQRRGLKLMVVVGHSIGLVAPEVLDSDPVITIATSRLQDEQDQESPQSRCELMLEAVRIADEQFPRYRPQVSGFLIGLLVSGLAVILSPNTPTLCLANTAGLR